VICVTLKEPALKNSKSVAQARLHSIGRGHGSHGLAGFMPFLTALNERDLNHSSCP
jgi:hypothetical protein